MHTSGVHVMFTYKTLHFLNIKFNNTDDTVLSKLNFWRHHESGWVGRQRMDPRGHLSIFEGTLYIEQKTEHARLKLTVRKRVERKELSDGPRLVFSGGVNA